MMSQKEVEKLKNMARKSEITFYGDYPTKFCVFKSLTLQKLLEQKELYDQYISAQEISLQIGKSTEAVYFLMSAIGFLQRKHLEQQICYAVTIEGSYFSKDEKGELLWNKVLASLLLEYIRLESE